MTNGTRVTPGKPFANFDQQTVPPYTLTSLGTGTVGYRDSRVWSGGDSPTQRRTYTHHWYRLPPKTTKVRVPNANGKGYHIVERVKQGSLKRIRIYDDKKRRVFREDHPYSLSAWKIRSVPHVYDLFALDSSVFPPVGSIRTNHIEMDSHGQFGDGFSIAQVWSSNDDIALLGKLRERIAGTDFNMGVFLGESRKGLDMITKSATTIFNAYTHVRRGNIAAACRVLRVPPPRIKTRSDTWRNDASARWLELQYGWMPLFKDVYDGAGMLATRLNAPSSMTFRARRKRNAVTAPTQAWVKSKVTAYTSGQIVARLTEVSETKLAGLQDPASVVWELIPFSFVLDWFIPIGSYLHARALDSALTGSYVTTKTVRSATMCDGLPDIPGVPANLVPIGQTHAQVYLQTQRVDMERVVSTSLSVPLPSFKKLSDVPSYKRAANAVSLILQASIRRRGSQNVDYKGYETAFDRYVRFTPYRGK